MAVKIPVTGVNQHSKLFQAYKRSLRGGVPKFALVSKADAAAVGKYTWRLNSRGYAFTSSKNISGGYKTKDGRNVVYLHQFVASRAQGGIRAGLQVDHKNRLRFDNTRTNLRQVTRKENIANRNPRTVSAAIKRGQKAAIKSGGRAPGRPRTVASLLKKR